MVGEVVSIRENVTASEPIRDRGRSLRKYGGNKILGLFERWRGIVKPVSKCERHGDHGECCKEPHVTAPKPSLTVTRLSIS